MRGTRKRLGGRLHNSTALLEGEQVVSSTIARRDVGPFYSVGKLYLTTERLIFLHLRWALFGKTLALPLSNIEDVQIFMKPWLFWRMSMGTLGPVRWAIFRGEEGQTGFVFASVSFEQVLRQTAERRGWHVDEVRG